MNGREGEWRKKRDLLSIGLSRRPSVAASAKERFPKQLVPPASLSLRDISILASFDGSENAVGIRWKLHPSIFSGLGPKERGPWRCPRVFRPHNVANDEGEGNWVTAEEKGKVSSIIFTFFFYVVLFLIYFSAFSVLSYLFAVSSSKQKGTLCLLNKCNLLLVK
jgi:hypothetical protein